MNAWCSMTDESEDLAEIAQALLDQDTGNFTVEATEHLEYAGIDLGSATLLAVKVVRQQWISKSAISLTMTTFSSGFR